MELSRNVIKFVIGVLLTILGFFVSHSVYFSKNPLFGVPFFGQTLFAFAFGAFAVLVLPVLTSAIVEWFETVIAKTAMKAVSDFWEAQSRKMQDAKKRKEEEAQKEREYDKAVVLDTSVVIDGRVIDIVKAGFLDTTLLVPQAVIDELQLISDSSDVLKRQRGRRGLDILKDLKRVAKVVILEREEEFDGNKSKEVDKILVKVAKSTGSKLATVDYNLNKVASLSGVKVLNVNELSNAIKAVVLPGEPLKMKIVQLGKDASQGVGYLPDGTMIVVEGGSDLIGKEAEVIVSRILQTPAGKMIFAKKS
ncbi:hypothetical protein A2716_01730 [candidate division WWE3 bacterium RIFCSPHIGHO2_01_FULL_40_23]|uniref:TRAM domain-containing protein n=1 Tax=candidate division WWE3 bacterium RIFCSPLOWO2_01_FULL_41_18 TaxID=1802625 RepID=A0A1F4VG79_UNCKA|nr:MAG: hypothetical protein A2716_01730 [candidate division WWE3 bacterium RIFCSPHIGHO2_01_FULL_40_23]OGC55713.1 MAG: hypothetical protein A3A78_01580 [candidate division WWE3 bacterium RIFCSPLOWO2_01_FULL_41_18]